MPFKQETYPPNIKYVKDSKQNRQLLSSILGKPKFQGDNFNYISIDIKEKTWRTHFDYEWLYRNIPPLSIIDELIL